MIDSRRRALIESFERMGLMKTLNVRVERVEPGLVALSMPISPAISQQHGVAHAGASFSLGDSASGYAALTMMPDGAEVMTVEMKINLIAPAMGRRLVATGEVLKSGRRLSVTRCTVQAELEDGTLRDVALLQGTMIPV